MATKTRMTAAERRNAILQAVIPVFAKKGFSAATTRSLAESAGVSEALLYQHFPSKESLYAAITSAHMEDEEIHPGFEKILAMEPSTERLIAGVQYLITHVAHGRDDRFPRLMGQSLLSDGVFARAALKDFHDEMFSFLQDSVVAAQQSGDMDPRIGHAGIHFWLVQHLAMAMRFMTLPDKSTVKYGLNLATVVDEAVQFVLRGMGIKKTAIDEYYDPAAWQKLRG